MIIDILSVYLMCLLLYCPRFGSNLIIVADQTVRDKVLCPAFKNLVFENLNDLEYCVLEAIAKYIYNFLFEIILFKFFNNLLN